MLDKNQLSTGFWHTIKIWIFYKLCKFIKTHPGGKDFLRLKPKNMKPANFLTLLALVFGTIIYKALSHIFDRILCQMLNMRTLSSFDEFFLSDPKKCKIGGVMRFPGGFDFNKMSEYLKNT